jgi:peroxiredoxin
MTPQRFLHHSAPVFALPDLEGNLHRLVDYRGDIIILNFWSAECPWSERTDRELLPLVSAWNISSGNKHPRVVLIPIAPNANEPQNMLTSVAADRGLPFVLQDADRLVTKVYGAQTTPHLFVIDPEGNLRYQGAFDDVTFRQRIPSQYYLKDAVDALLRGDSPDPWETPAYGCTIVHFAG